MNNTRAGYALSQVVMLALLVACGGGGNNPTGSTGCTTSCTPKPPTGIVEISSATATPATPYVGDSVALTVTARADSGALGPDSIVVPTGTPRINAGATYTGKAPAALGSNSVPFTAWGRNSIGTPISTGSSVSFTGAARPDSVTWTLQFYDTVGDTLLRGTASLPMGGISISIVDGRGSVRLQKGKLVTLGMVLHAASQDVDAFEFADGSRRSNFPDFQYATGAALGTDTITPMASQLVKLYRPSRTGAYWNDANLAVYKGHCQLPGGGNMLPSPGPLKLYALTDGFTISYPQFDGSIVTHRYTAMDPVFRTAITQVWREYQQRYPWYQFTLDSGTTPPMDSITLPGGTRARAAARRTIWIGQREPSSAGQLPSAYYDVTEPWLKSIEAGAVQVDKNPYNAVAYAKGWFTTIFREELGFVLDMCDDIPGSISFQAPSWDPSRPDLEDWQPWDYARRKFQDRHSVPAVIRRKATATTKSTDFVPPYLIVR